MFRIVSPWTEAYSNLNPSMQDFVEIMNTYNKGILMIEIGTYTVYTNALAEEVFAYTLSDVHMQNFLEEHVIHQITPTMQKKTVVLDALSLILTISIKSIRERDAVKFIICTLEEIIPLQVVKKEEKIEEVFLEDIIGESEAIKDLKKMVMKAAKSDSTVLLMGATGSGKEMFAKTIHRVSDRRNKPFVAINCGAIPDTLIESELFGYDKGAFTGASQKGKQGKFEQANGGTVFLDEIENMSIYLQMKLLRVLEDRTVTRVGGLEDIPLDMRILAATNSDLKSMVDRGEFRRDLYYRLNIIKLNVPSLSERGSDVLMLSQHFINMFSLKMKKQVRDLSDEVKKMFMQYEWEGNVRELRNIIEYAMNFEDSELVTSSSLPEYFFMKNKPFEKNPEFRTIAELEREEIVRALDHFGWDDKGKKKVAKVLEISRSSIYRKVLKE